VHEGRNLVAGLPEAGVDNRALVAQALLGAAQRQVERGQVGTAQITQFDALEVVLDALIRVELRRVARQALQVQAFGRPWARKSLIGWPR
jgi:hypothetical protein